MGDMAQRDFDGQIEAMALAGVKSPAPAFRAEVGGRNVLKLKTLSVNEATTYRTCPRLYWYGYVADGTGYEVRGKSFALTFGDYWHRAQEAWWLARKRLDGGLPGEWIDAALHAVDHPQPDSHGYTPPKLEVYDRARIRAMMALYHLVYSTDGLSVLAVEREFKAPLISPKGGKAVNWDGLDGRMDLVVANRRNEAFVGEHKTTGLTIDDDSDYWDRVKFDMQISQYIEGARHIGYPVVGLIYDVARRPHAMLKANKPEPRESPEAFEARLLRALAEEPKKYLRRKLVVRTDAEMAEARRDTWATARQIAQSHREDLWPRHAVSCSRYGHKCEFFDVCAGEVDLRDPSKFQQKKNSQSNSNAATKKEIATV